MKKPKAASCSIRYVRDDDYPVLENFYLRHEGESLPSGYFTDFADAIRDPEVIYFVGEFEGKVIGGGGISNYYPGQQASLTFGIVNPDFCRRGFGTSILVARLLFASSPTSDCHVSLEATDWSAPFFSRLGFQWHNRYCDSEGNTFLQGNHIIYPGDDATFRTILNEGDVTLEYGNEIH